MGYNHYFSSKDELIIELYKALKRKFANAILENFDEGKPLIAQIRQVFEDTFRYSPKIPTRVCLYGPVQFIPLLSAGSL